MSISKTYWKKWLGLEYIKAFGEKWVNDMNQKSSQEPWEAHKYGNLFLSLSSIREMEIKSIRFYVLQAAIRQAAIFFKSENSGVGNSVEQLKLSPCWLVKQPAQLSWQEN